MFPVYGEAPLPPGEGFGRGDQRAKIGIFCDTLYGGWNLRRDNGGGRRIDGDDGGQLRQPLGGAEDDRTFRYFYAHGAPLRGEPSEKSEKTVLVSSSSQVRNPANSKASWSSSGSAMLGQACSRTRATAARSERARRVACSPSIRPWVRIARVWRSSAGVSSRKE